MRVLFWAETFWPHIGGAQLGALELILALRQRGYDFIVVTRKDDPSESSVDEYAGVPIYRFPFWKAVADKNLSQLLEAKRKVAKLKQDFAPELVHLHGLGPSAFFVLESSKAYPVPLLVTLTGMAFEAQEGLQLYTRVLRASDWVTVKSKAILTSAHQMVPEIKPRSSVVYRGRTDLLPQLSSLPMVLPRIVCVGRLDAIKGFDLALSAFSTIVRKFPEMEMVIAGDGPQRSRLEQHAESLGLTEKVKWLGWMAPEKIPVLLATALVVLIPSRSEGLPRVAVEAALMARPVVGTRVGGIPEVVLHEQTGLLVEPENDRALAEAITFLMTHQDLGETMGHSARKLALEKFRPVHCMDSYQALYQQLTQNPVAK